MGRRISQLTFPPRLDFGNYLSPVIVGSKGFHLFLAGTRMMSDENVIAGTGKSKKRLVLGLAAVMSLSSLGAGAYVWAKRDTGTSAEAEPKVASPDQFAGANPIRPIPISDRTDLSALSPTADPYGSPRATPWRNR